MNHRASYVLSIVTIPHENTNLTCVKGMMKPRVGVNKNLEGFKDAFIHKKLRSLILRKYLLVPGNVMCILCWSTSEAQGRVLYVHSVIFCLRACRISSVNLFSDFLFF